jgi:hypothetical protein
LIANDYNKWFMIGLSVAQILVFCFIMTFSIYPDDKEGDLRSELKKKYEKEEIEYWRQQCNEVKDKPLSWFDVIAEKQRRKFKILYELDQEYKAKIELREEAERKENACKARRIIVGVLIELFIGLGTILYLIFCVVLLIISKVIESKPENEDYSSSVAILIGIGLYVPMWDNVN